MKRVTTITTIVLSFVLLCACSTMDETTAEVSKPHSSFSSKQLFNERLVQSTPTPNNSESNTNDESDSNTYQIKSYPGPFVKLNGKTYYVTDNTDIEVDEEINEVATHITDERETADNYSNFYPKGAKVWSIKDVSPDEAIAIEYPTGTFTKCVIR